MKPTKELSNVIVDRSYMGGLFPPPPSNVLFLLAYETHDVSMTWLAIYVKAVVTFLIIFRARIIFLFIVKVKIHIAPLPQSYVD